MIYNGSRHDSTGSHYYVNGVEVPREVYRRCNMIVDNPNPEYWATIRALKVCTNCLCSFDDCGCCHGCGGIDADISREFHGPGVCV